MDICTYQQLCIELARLGQEADVARGHAKARLRRRELARDLLHERARRRMSARAPGGLHERAADALGSVHGRVEESGERPAHPRARLHLHHTRDDAIVAQNSGQNILKVCI
jgi:hypothetical protein